MKDTLTANKELKGIFILEMRDRNGNIIDRYEDRNLIVDKARYNMARLISASGNNYYIEEIHFGTGTTDPDPGDLALTDPDAKAFDSIDYPDNHSVNFNWSLGLDDLNGKSITEFGLISHNGDLFARKVRAAIVKTADFSITGTWKIVF